MTDARPNPPTSMKHHRFHFLDALRGLAAILIILRHAPEEYTSSLRFPSSFLAVDFFFCLSGFVIAFSYEQRLRDSLTFKQFFIARLIRLYPAAALGTVLGALGLLLNRVADPTVPSPHLPTLFVQFLLSLFILPDLTARSIHASLFTLDGVMWTLFFELIANFVYAAMLRLRSGQTWLIATVVVISTILLALEIKLLHFMDTGFSYISSPVGLFRVALSFGMGVLIFRLFHHDKFPAIHGVNAGVVTLAIAGALTFVLCNSVRVLQLPGAQLALVCIAFPLLIFAAAHVHISARWVSLCVALGAISYPLYILHVPLLWPLRLHRSRLFALGHPASATPIVLTYCVVLIAIVWLIAEFYDAPLRSYITGKYRSLSPPSPRLTSASPQELL